MTVRAREGMATVLRWSARLLVRQRILAKQGRGNREFFQRGRDRSAQVPAGVLPGAFGKNRGARAVREIMPRNRSKNDTIPEFRFLQIPLRLPCPRNQMVPRRGATRQARTRDFKREAEVNEPNSSVTWSVNSEALSG